MKHLTSIEIFETVNGTVKPHEHFLTCDDCLRQTVSLVEFRLAAGKTAVMGGTLFLMHGGSGDCVGTEEIAEFYDGQSPRPEFIKEHLQACDRCFELASYYFAESAGMRGALDAATPARYKEGALNLMPKKRIVSKGRLRLPRWIIAPLPAYAAAALLWAAVNYTITAPQVTTIGNPPHYTVYKKDPDARPLYYFGVKGRQVLVQPAKMEISATRHDVTFSWEAVTGVKEYYFVLQEIRGTAPRLVRNLSVKTDSLTLRRELFLPDARYRWIVAGGLPPDKYFDGRMEFTIR